MTSEVVRRIKGITFYRAVGRSRKALSEQILATEGEKRPLRIDIWVDV